MILKLAIAYIFILIGFLLITGLNNKFLSKKVFRNMLILLVVSFSIMAYYTEANSWEGDDLGRYFLSMDSYREVGLQYVLENGLWKETPLASIEMYLFSLTGNNHLLPAFNAIIIWGVYFYIIYREIPEAGLVSLKKALFCLIGLVSTVNLYESISNIRYPLAAAILVLAIYLDTQKDLHIRTIPLYIASCLFHVAMIPIVIIRLVLIVPLIRKNIWIVFFIIALFFGTMSTFLQSSNNLFLQYLGGKVELYEGQVVYGNLYYLGMLTRFVGVILISVWGTKTSFLKKRHGQNFLEAIIKGISFLGVGFLFFSNTFSFRMTSVIYSISITKFSNKHNQVAFDIGVFLLAFGIMIGFYYNFKNYYLNWPFLE